MQKFRSHTVVKFNGKKIAIKTERDVEIRLQMKKEANIPKEKTNVANASGEKEKLNKQIVALKTEKQQNN